MSNLRRRLLGRPLMNYLLVSLVSIGLTLVGLGAFPAAMRSQPAPPPSAVVAQAAAPAAVPSRSDLNFVATAVDRVGPAVVRLDTQRTVSTNFRNPFANDPFFREFFGDDLFSQIPQEYQQRGQGSGFIIDRSGILLTNAHVVSGADQVTVSLKDGRTFQGEVLGIDEPSDLAVVKIDGQDLPVAPVGRSSQVKVGDWAIAVGNPLGLDNTVTLGIVSTLNRPSSQVGIPDKRLEFIQTDAAINPGNSGGPLLNAQGEVIGINTAIRAGAQGIGFAIPIDHATQIKDVLARGERVPYPYIGIQMRTLTPELAREVNQDPNAPFTLPEVNGVLVMQVAPESPAAIAGLRRGDVVTAIDGDAIASAEDLQQIVQASEVNQSLQFTVQRGRDRQQISVRTGDLQDAT